MFSWRELQYTDNRFGDYYIQLPVGVIFHPSFFTQRDSNSPKGMHGYWRDENNYSRLVSFNNYNLRYQGNYILEMDKLYRLLRFFLCNRDKSLNFNKLLQSLV